MSVVSSLEVPTRAHGLTAEADGSILALARRPGDWMVRWHPERRKPQWVWAEAGRAFNGHAARSADGRRIFTTETDLDSGNGLIGVWDARGLEKQDEWPTGGIDAHEILVDGASLLVANGGVPTRPETGRAKRDLHKMDSSLVRLGARDGSMLGQWRLADSRLSLRHLARNGNLIGIAMQAEHDTPALRETAPVLAIFDGTILILPESAETPNLRGYGGDIAAWQDGFAISAPRAHSVVRWRPRDGWQAGMSLQEGCALANREQDLWAGGSMQAHGAGPDLHAELDLPAGLRLDNHWVVI